MFLLRHQRYIVAFPTPLRSATASTVLAFTDFGIETPQNLSQIYKEDPDLPKRLTNPL